MSRSFWARWDAGEVSTVRSILWNIAGQAVPLVASFVAVPLLIYGLGLDRFGILGLVWALLGYFTLFDLGLGRSLTKLVAENLVTDRPEFVARLFWAGAGLAALAGCAGGLILASLAPWLVDRALGIPTYLREETLWAMRLVAASLPLVTLTAVLQGVVEAQRRFDVVTIVRIFLALVTLFSPWLILPLTPSLRPIVAVLIGGRLIAAGLLLGFNLRALPVLRQGIAWSGEAAAALLRFGGWMTVTNVVGPLMVYFDRFLIAGLTGAGAVPFYSVPYDAVTKLWVIPVAVAGVLFATLPARLIADPQGAVALYRRGMKCTGIVLFPAVVLLVAFAREALRLWLGPAFADRSTAVLQWLAIGVFLNSLGQIAFAFVQAAGRPHWTARVHLFELPVYLLAVWWLVQKYGVVGAAVAWVARVAVDTAILLVLTSRILPSTAVTARAAAWIGATTVLAAVLGALVADVRWKVLVVSGLLVILASVAWFRFLDQDERLWVRSVLIRRMQ